MAELQRPIEPGRLYRYRALSRPGAFQQELKSIVEKYLYCSEFTRMNDPMEGFYRPSKLLKGRSDYEHVARQVAEGKSLVGIACLTETYDNVLMWTHYAGNYAGICLAYSTAELLDGLPENVSLVRLSYVDQPTLIYPRHAKDANEAALRILSQKKYNWAYEREWRVLGPVGKVSTRHTQAVKSIYLGSRIAQRYRDELVRIGRELDIDVHMMEINGYEHTWKRIKRLAVLRKRSK